MLAVVVGKTDPRGETPREVRDRGRSLAGNGTLNRLELTLADDRAIDEALEEALSLPPERHFERDLEAYRRDRLAEKMAGILRGALGGRTLTTAD
jgi:hypothetical protein